MDLQQEPKSDGLESWPISIDLEVSAWPGLIQYLETELATQYQRAVVRAGDRLFPHSLTGLRLLGDELEAELVDGAKTWRVRMSLPIFDWDSGLSLISCACQRESLHLEERRCAHMYVAEKALLQKLLHLQGPPAAETGSALIEALEQYLSESLSETNPTNHSDKRIVWVLTADFRLEARLQTQLASNRWTSGKRLAWNEFFEAQNYWQDLDYKLASQIRPEGLSQGRVEYRPNYSLMLKALIDSPNLFFEANGEQAVSFQHESLVIQTEQSDQKLKLTPRLGTQPIEYVDLESAMLFGFDRAANCIFYHQTDRATAKLVEQLQLQGSDLPAAQQSVILDYMVRLNERQLPIALDPGLSQESVAADDTMIVRLTPFANGTAKLEVLCRPAAGGISLAPGCGPERILHKSESGVVQTIVRDFFKEQALAQQLIEDLELDRFGLRYPVNCYLPGTDAILDILEKAHSFSSSRLAIEWPKSDTQLANQWRLAPPMDQQKIVMRVGEKKDWLAVEGHIEIDGQEVNLQELMRSLRSNRQYVQLTDGRWSRISESLKNRIAELNSALDEEAEQIRMNPAALEEIARLEAMEQVQIAAAGKRWQKVKKGFHASRNLDESLPSNLQASLRPYQLEGFRWLNRLATWGMGACLADDMGLGKTLQTLAVLLKRQQKGPSLVIAPTSVIANWAHECRRFCPDLEIIDYRQSDRSFESWRPKSGQVVLASYGLVLRDQLKLAEIPWNILVIDEAQSIKNAKSQTAKAIQSLQANWTLALSGTPIENHLGDLWSLFRTISPGLLGSWSHFRRAYGFPILAGDDEARLRLKKRIQPFILRRLKKDYLKDLPPKQEIDMRVSLSDQEREIYDALRLNAIAAMEAAGSEQADSLDEAEQGQNEQKKRLQILGMLTRMRLAICHPRLVKDDWTLESAKLELLGTMLGRLESQQSQVLIFSQFTRFLKLVKDFLQQRGFGQVAYLDGQTLPDERARLVQAFQVGEYRIFLISLKAGGTGLNLTKADMVIHLDPWWNPAVEDQATDRAYRMGQMRQVMVYRLIAEKTIEEEILKLHAEKRNLANGILAQDGQRMTAQLSSEELLKLIRHS